MSNAGTNNNGTAKKNTAQAPEPEERPMTVNLSLTDRIINGAQLAAQSATAIFSGISAFGDSNDDPDQL